VKNSLGTPSTTEVLPSKPKRPIVNARPSDQNIKTAPERHILRFLLVSWLKERFSIHRIGMFRTLGIALLCLVALAPSRVEAEAPTVIVKQGDALSLIAERAGVSVEQIKEWNHLNGDLIRIGHKGRAHSRRLGGGRHRLDAAIRLWVGSSRSTGSSE
jgi:LysM repeat protein